MRRLLKKPHAREEPGMYTPSPREKHLFAVNSYDIL